MQIEHQYQYYFDNNSLTVSVSQCQLYY